MKKTIAMAAVIMTFLMLSACEKYEDGRPEKMTRNEFSQMFPDAKDVEWEREGGCWKVSFETGKGAGRVDHEAWYGLDGSWLRTESEMGLSAVPQYIKDYLEASEYGSASFEDHDAEYIQTPSGNHYRFDLIHSGVKIYVDVSEDGKVILAKFDW